jgi:heptosyltransferase-2
MRRKSRFDLAINPRWGTDGYFAGFVVLFSQAERRIGYASGVDEEKRIWNRGFDLLYTEVVPGSRWTHEADRGIAILEYLGLRPSMRSVEVWLTPEDGEFANQVLGPGNHQWIALAPGAGHARRRWPPERFQEVVARLVGSGRTEFLVVGGYGDREVGGLLQAVPGARIVNCAGSATLRQSAALLRRCAVLLANDSGPLHLGVAVGTPVIEISCHPRGGDRDHIHSPERFGPRNGGGTVLQPQSAVPPCTGACVARDPHCILQISTGEVFDSTDAILKEREERA